MIVKNISNNILNAFFGRTGSVTLAQTAYIGLSTTTPDSSGGNFTEPATSAGYSRTLIGNYNQASTQLMDAAADGSISNAHNIIFFPEATTTWNTITHFGIFTAKTGGTPILWGALSSNINVPAGYIPIFRAGSLTVSLQ